MDTPPTQYLTETALAQRLGLSLKTLQAWRAQRRGPAFLKLGTARKAVIRYSLAAVEDWERHYTVATAPAVPRGLPPASRGVPADPR